MLVDSIGRVHDYLRISLTEKCNLRCTYCMPENGLSLRPKEQFMTADELVSLAETFVRLGVKKIRITGGEPLVRKDVVEIITRLASLPVELSITTNGVLLDTHFEKLEELGIKKLNISIDSLKKDVFNKIARRNYFDQVIENIYAAIQKGFDVKLNVVVIKGVNEGEIVDFVRWTVGSKIQVRFIEFMPFDGNRWDWDKVVTQQEMMTLLAQHFDIRDIIPLKEEANLISRNYQLFDAKGSFGFISTLTNSFCDTCNRIRLTADGKIKNCLFSADETDLLSVLRAGEDVTPLILNSIESKHAKNAGINFTDTSTMHEHRSMIAIGG